MLVQHGNEFIQHILESIASLASQLRVDFFVGSAKTEQACWRRQLFGRAPFEHSYFGFETIQSVGSGKAYFRDILSLTYFVLPKYCETQISSFITVKPKHV